MFQWEKLVSRLSKETSQPARLGGALFHIPYHHSVSGDLKRGANNGGGGDDRGVSDNRGSTQ